MGFPDFPISEQDKSYIPAEDVLRFLNAYADHFDVRKYIKVQAVFYVCLLYTSSTIEIKCAM